MTCSRCRTVSAPFSSHEADDGNVHGVLSDSVARQFRTGTRNASARLDKDFVELCG